MIESLEMSPTTKERILDAAETLFAEQGFTNTSLRSLTAQAKANLAAVNYHFGSKDELIEAMFARRMTPMNQERLSRLEALESQYRGQKIPLESLVEAFIGPALELSRDTTQGGSLFIKLLGRSYAEPSPQLQDRVRAMHCEVIERFKTAFTVALPNLSSDELYWRLHFLVGALAYCMSGADMIRLIASCRITNPLEAESMTQRLTVFVTAGLRAPQTSGEDRQMDAIRPAVSA